MAMSIKDQIATAKTVGVNDAYSFAEWLVDDQEHFGHPSKLSESDAEMAYEQAMNWWMSYNAFRCIQLTPCCILHDLMRAEKVAQDEVNRRNRKRA